MRRESATVTRQGKPVAELRPLAAAGTLAATSLERWHAIPVLDLADLRSRSHAATPRRWTSPAGRSPKLPWSGRRRSGTPTRQSRPGSGSSCCSRCLPAEPVAARCPGGRRLERARVQPPIWGAGGSRRGPAIGGRARRIARPAGRTRDRPGCSLSSRVPLWAERERPPDRTRRTRVGAVVAQVLTPLAIDESRQRVLKPRAAVRSSWGMLSGLVERVQLGEQATDRVFESLGSDVAAHSHGRRRQRRELLSTPRVADSLNHLGVDGVNSPTPGDPTEPDGTRRVVLATNGF